MKKFSKIFGAIVFLALLLISWMAVGLLSFHVSRIAFAIGIIAFVITAFIIYFRR